MPKCKECKFSNGAPLCDIIGEEDQICGCGKYGNIIINNNYACGMSDFIERTIDVGLTLNELNMLNDILLSYKEGNFECMTNDEIKSLENLNNKLFKVFEKND